MINKIYHIMIALGLYALPLAAQAQTQTASPQTSYAQLAALNDQIALLKAQVQVAQLQQELAVATHATTMVQNGVPDLPSSSITTLVSPHTTQTTPHIIAISGRGRRLSALVQMPQGDEMMVVPGTTLSNGAIVQSITPQSVVVLLNNQTLSLPFSGAPHTPGGP